jgi:hypothetical protein
MEKYAIAVGDLFESIYFYGVFDTYEQAEDYAHGNVIARGWVVITIHDASVL